MNINAIQKRFNERMAKTKKKRKFNITLPKKQDKSIADFNDFKFEGVTKSIKNNKSIKSKRTMTYRKLS